MPSRALDIRDAKYQLRPLVIEDSDVVSEFYKDQHFWKHLREGPLSKSQTRAIIADKVGVSGQSDGRETWWAVLDPETSAVIGTANVKRVGLDQDKRGSVGCALAPDAQGRGLGPRLGWNLIVLGFEQFAFDIIECTCAEDNARSVHTMRDTFQMTYDGMRETQRSVEPRLWREHVFFLRKDVFLTLRNDVEARLAKSS